MTEKDLMKGLNYIEDSLVEEAAKTGKIRKFLSLPAAAAAMLVLGAGVYAATSGLFFHQGGPDAGQQVVLQESVDREEDNDEVFLEEEFEEAMLEDPREEVRAEEDAGALLPEAEDMIPEAQEGEEAEKTAAAVGVAGFGDLGDDYHAAADYGEVYDLLKAGQKTRQEAARAEETRAAALFDTAGDLSELAGNPDMMAAAESADVTAAAMGAGGSGDYSATNVMTEGVDESDIIKTDGRFIYVVNAYGIDITDIREGKPGDTTTLQMPEEAAMDRISEIYVDTDSLVVLGWKMPDQDAFRTWEDALQGTSAPSGRANLQTIAAVFRLEEAGTPVFLGAARQDGSYRTSRKVGDTVYLFTDCSVALPDLEKDEALTEEALSNWIPQVNGKPVAADCIYLTENASSGILISSLKTSAPEETVDAKFLFTSYAETYMGPDALYLYYEKFIANENATRILKLPCRDGLISAGCSATVRGSIRDSFAIQEKNGSLRVLTTDWGWEDASNRLILLDEDLEETGRLEDIAHGEMIYAARYINDLAYFVTYRNTDPLFAADLSDPSNPVLLGEMKISGFSEYLHPWDETRLLGIGYETDPDNGNFLGVKLTMFDISDPVHITAEDVRVLEGDSGSSAIDWNYKAILAAPGKNLIGFMTWKRVDGGMAPCYNVFSYDPEEGFTTKLRNAWKGYDELYEECRGLYAGDTFYVVDAAHIYAYEMTDEGAWTEIEE